MRKFFNMALGLILIFALSSCSSNSHVSLPKAEDIEKVELTHSDNKANELISDQVEISNLIENLTESSRKTYKGSVNDEPTNVDQYITINFYHKDSKDNPSRVHLYKENNFTYIEQPYSGIWRVDNNIFEKIDN